jgi:hypothetical protein
LKYKIRAVFSFYKSNKIGRFFFAKSGGESRRGFFSPPFDSFFGSFQTQQIQRVKQQQEQKSIQYIRPTIDRSLRNDATTPRVVLLLIGFLSQLLDDRIEVTDDVEKRRAFLIDRVPHVFHQRHEFFRHQPVV